MLPMERKKTGMKNPEDVVEGYAATSRALHCAEAELPGFLTTQQ